jgi:hypothetical protein
MPLVKFIDEVRQGQTPRDVSTVLLSSVEAYGFACVAIGQLPETRDRPPVVALGWPAGWIERFLTGGCYAHDPVLRCAREMTEPFVWSDARREGPAGEMDRRLAAEAQRHGIADGIAIPVLALDGSQWVVLLGGRPIDLNFELRQSLRLQAIYALHRVRELEVIPNFAGRGANASERPAISVHVVRLENRWFYERELAEVQRLSSLIGRQPGPFGVPSGLSPDAEVHLLAIEQGTRRALGCIQLESTTSSFDACQPGGSIGALPRSPSVLRVTGLHLPADGQEGQRLGAVTAAMMAGLQEFGLKSNVEQILMDVAVFQLPALLELGWCPEPIELPRTGATANPTVSLTVEITETALRRTRRMLGVPGPVVVRRKLRRVPARPVWSPRRLYH